MYDVISSDSGRKLAGLLAETFDILHLKSDMGSFLQKPECPGDQGVSFLHPEPKSLNPEISLGSLVRAGNLREFAFHSVKTADRSIHPGLEFFANEIGCKPAQLEIGSVMVPPVAGGIDDLDRAE